jgi:hypothetical protein
MKECFKKIKMNYDEMEFRKISSKKIKRKSVYDELKK